MLPSNGLEYLSDRCYEEEVGRRACHETSPMPFIGAMIFSLLAHPIQTYREIRDFKKPLRKLGPAES